MSKLDQAISELHTIDELSKQDRWVNRIHPSVKLFLTLFFIILTVSFGKYELTGLLGLCIYPLFLFVVGDLQFGAAFRRVGVVLPFVGLVGIFNPIFDRQPVLSIGALVISGGVLSFLGLVLKALLTVLSAYILIATTPIEQICASLRGFHVPKSIVITVLLIYRYLTVLLKEARRVTQAYALRAPGQRGVQYRAWGPLLGQLLLRSMDRAERIYAGMQLRGYDGNFLFASAGKLRAADILYGILLCAAFLLCRYVDLSALIGSLFV